MIEHRLGAGRIGRIHGGNVAAHPRDVPGAVRLPRDAADTGRLLDGGVGDAEAAGEAEPYYGVGLSNRANIGLRYRF